METIGIKEVMQLLQVGRPLATRYLQTYLGKTRKKGKKYVVVKSHFMKWLEDGGLSEV
jgi:hypothetical protein